MLLDVPVLFFTRRAVGTRESFHITHVKLPKFPEVYGLRLAALVASEKVKEETSTAIDRETSAAINAPGLNLMSHRNLDSPDDQRTPRSRPWARNHIEFEGERQPRIGVRLNLPAMLSPGRPMYKDRSQKNGRRTRSDAPPLPCLIWTIALRMTSCYYGDVPQVTVLFTESHECVYT